MTTQDKGEPRGRERSIPDSIVWVPGSTMPEAIYLPLDFAAKGASKFPFLFSLI